MSCSAQKLATQELLKKYSKKQKVKKTRKVKLRFVLLISLILGLTLPKMLFKTYDYLFIRKFQNESITLPNDPNYLNMSEKPFANDTFLGINNLGQVNTENTDMRALPLSGEMVKLKARLHNLIDTNPSLQPGIFIWDFNTGNYVSLNGDKEYPTASIIKLPILLELFKRVDKGLINLNDKMTIAPYYVTNGSGYLQYKPVGTTLSLQELTKKMIQESDNTATNMLLTTIGGVNDVNRTLRNWGFSQTHMSNWLPDLDGTNVSTPKDLATMIYNINNPKFFEISSISNIVDIMSHVKNRHLIQAALPDNAQFIHKTGDIGTMLGDAGKVTMPNGHQYIIVVMVKRPWNAYSAKEFIIKASELTYNSFITNDL